jgi:VanZ family protein
VSNRLPKIVGAAALLIGFVAAGHLLPGLDSSHVEASLRNSLHFLGFAVVAAVLFEVIPGRSLRKSITTLVVVVALGFLSEVTQQYAGRIFDLMDVARDVAGAAVFLLARVLWGKSREAGRSFGMRGFLVAAAAVVALLLFVPLAYWSATLNSYRSRMPIIADFSTAQDSRMLIPIESRISVDLDAGFAEIEQTRRRWSGVIIDTVVPDWSEYRKLVIRARMTGAPETKIDVELVDGDHPGYRSQHLLGGESVGSEFQNIRFALREAEVVPGRPGLDTTDIDRIYVIGKHKGTTATIFIDSIWLE